MTARVRSLLRRLGPPGVDGAGLRLLMVVSLVGSVGFGMYLSTGAIYFHRVVGLTDVQVGAGFSLGGLVWLVASVPVGRLVDRVGSKAAAVTTAVLQAALLVAALVVNGFAGFLVVLTALALAEQAGNVARGALIAHVVPPGQRVAVNAYLRTLFNIGVTLGIAAAVVPLAADSVLAYRATFVVDAGLVLVVAVAVGRISVHPGSRVAHRPLMRDVLTDRPFASVAVLCGLMGLQDTVLTIGVPLWVVTSTGAPPAVAAWVIGVNTVVVIALQVPLSAGVTSIHSAVRYQRLAAVASAAGCLLFVPTQGERWLAVGLLLTGTVPLALAEVWSSAASWHLRYDLADESAQGTYGSLFSLGQSVQLLAGPILVTALLQVTNGVGWALVAAVFTLVGLLIGPVAGWAERTRPTSTGEACDTDEAAIA